MSHFGPVDEPPLAVCERELNRSDIYVGLLGHRYGSLVRSGPSVSYTEFEFDYAGTAEIPRLVFLLRDNASVLEERFLSTTDRDRQEKFRAKVRANVVTVDFSTTDELRGKVLTALAKEVLRQSRTNSRRIPGGIRELTVAINEKVPEAHWCSEYLAGLIIGHKSEVPIATAEGVEFVPPSVAQSLGDSKDCESLWCFLELPDRLRRYEDQISLMIRIGEQIEVIKGMVGYLGDVTSRDSSVLRRLSARTPTGKTTTSGRTRLPRALDLLDKLRLEEDWVELARWSKRYVDSADATLRQTARADLMNSLIFLGRETDVLEAGMRMAEFATRPDATVDDLLRAITSAKRSGDTQQAIHFARMALAQWPSDYNIKSVAFQLGIIRRSGDDI